jgi:hypothetical protein
MFKEEIEEELARRRAVGIIKQYFLRVGHEIETSNNDSNNFK